MFYIYNRYSPSNKMRTVVSYSEYQRLINERHNHPSNESDMDRLIRDIEIRAYEEVYPRIHCFRCNESIRSHNYQGSGYHHRYINCHYISEIPSMHNVVKLEIYDCPRLTTISMMSALVWLEIHKCPSLKSIPTIHGIKSLDIYECPKLTSIPPIEGLEYLFISEANALTSIPIIPGLKVLSVDNCQKLKSIPFIKGLQSLSCAGSENLELIPTNAKNNRLPKKAAIMIKHGEYLTTYKAYKAYLTICIQYKRYKLKQQEMLRANQRKTFLGKCTHKLRTIIHGKGKRKRYT